MFGQNIESKNNKLPIKVRGSNFPRPINYTEIKGSAQVKSCILLAAMKTAGETKIKCIPSRDHTEKLFLSGVTTNQEMMISTSTIAIMTFQLFISTILVSPCKELAKFTHREL